jgi:23S rRNA pseudouridine1911/1915/1917 synthase
MAERATPIYRFVAALGDTLSRLDKFVVARLDDAGAKSSRAAVQRWMQAGRVTVDGQDASPSDRVSVGAVVEVRPLAPEPTNLEPDAGVRFDILSEDEHLIVIDKPGNLVVHPARGHSRGTLVHGLLARGAFERLAAQDAHLVPGARESVVYARPGIVHRLDKGTSGIMVVAKDEPTREGLKAQFARHQIDRLYYALVAGHASDRTFDTLHGRHRTQRLKFTTRVASGRRAVTRVRVLERFDRDGAALVECRLETGRTHQIRVHLAECANTPIIGDPLYGRPSRDGWIREVGDRLGRQALHAALLGFVHPGTGKKLTFEREPPADFMSALAALRRGRPPPRA